MAQLDINYGTPNNQDGDLVRDAWIKAQSNFTELYSLQLFTDRIISGSASWSGTGLTFDVTVDLYVLNGNVLPTANANGTIDSINTQVTLAAADPTLPRRDVIAVDENEQIVIIQGTPNANPQKPTVNFGTQLEITDVLISAGATTPDGVSDEIIYAEFQGEPNEWTVTENTSGARINLASNNDSDTGNVSIETINTNVSGDAVFLTNDVDINTENLTALVFRIKNKDLTKGAFQVSCLKDGVYLTQPVRIQFNRFGYQADNNTTYHTVIVPKDAFGFISNQFNQIRLDFTTNQVFIDNIKLTFGTANIGTTPGTYLGLTDTLDTTYAGKQGFIPRVNNSLLELVDPNTLFNIPTQTSDLINNGSDNTSIFVEADELGSVAFSNDYNDLNNLPTNSSDIFRKSDLITPADSFTEQIHHSGNLILNGVTKDTQFLNAFGSTKISNIGIIGSTIRTDGVSTNLSLQGNTGINFGIENGNSINTFSFNGGSGFANTNTNNHSIVNFTRNYTTPAAYSLTPEIYGLRVAGNVNFSASPSSSDLGSYTSFFSNIVPTNVGTVYALGGIGKIKLSDYGSGNVSGTPTFNLAVDLDGNFIETDLFENFQYKGIPNIENNIIDGFENTGHRIVAGNNEGLIGITTEIGEDPTPLISLYNDNTNDYLYFNLYSWTRKQGVNITEVNIANNSLNIISNNNSFIGINGDSYYGNNYLDNSFVQKKYVDDQVANASSLLEGYKETGKKLDGDLVVSIGDFDGENNETRFILNDITSTSTLESNIVNIGDINATNHGSYMTFSSNGNISLGDINNNSGSVRAILNQGNQSLDINAESIVTSASGISTTLTFDALQDRTIVFPDKDGIIAFLSDISGGGDVFKVNTPVDNEIGVWTGDGTIEGDSNFTWDGNGLIVDGNFVSGTAPLTLIPQGTIIDGVHTGMNIKMNTDQVGGSLGYHLSGNGQTWSMILEESVNGSNNNFSITDNYGDSGAHFRINGITNLTTLPTSTITGIDSDNTGKAIATKEWVESNSNSSTYSVYTALITQTGTNNPVATILENNLGGSIVWSRVSLGNYIGVLGGAFADAKVAIFFGGNRTFPDTTLRGRKLNNNAISITANFESSGIDGLLSDTIVEVRVYS